MTSVAFGLDYHALTDPHYRDVVENIQKSNVRISVLTQAAELTAWRMDRKLFPDSLIARNAFIKFVSQLLRTRLQAKQDDKRPNLFSFLMNAKDPETGSGLRHEEIGAESTTLIVAGSDTSSTAMAALFFYLSNHPKSYDKACAEVRSIFGTSDEVRLGPSLNSCLYLRACVDEAMRMSPPVGSALWREVQIGGLQVDEQSLPAGYDVGVSIYALHHNEELYPQAFEFMPERWLASERSEEDILRARSGFQPFSMGPRGCIGKGLALQETMLLMATILVRFDFRTAEGSGHQVGAGGSPGAVFGRHRATEFQLRDHITASKEGPLLQFCQRE